MTPYDIANPNITPESTVENLLKVMPYPDAGQVGLLDHLPGGPLAEVVSADRLTVAVGEH